MNKSPSNIFQSLFLLESYHQNDQAVLTATGMIGSIIENYTGQEALNGPLIIYGYIY